MENQGNANAEGSVGSSPSRKSAQVTPLPPSRSAVGTTFQMRSELPALPSTANITFQQSTADDKSAGNFNYTTALLEQGFLGYWRRRQDTAFTITPVYIQPMMYYNGILDTLTGVLVRLLTLKSELDLTTMNERVAHIARTLTCGCCVMTFLKLRNILISELPNNRETNNLKKPRISDALALPSGFAFAIQQLGIVNVADSVQEQIFAPTFPNVGHTLGIPDELNLSWNPHAYAEAVEYARTLGMKFAILDLKKKDGSAWWLFRQVYLEGIFELHCPIPETNFTKSMAVTHSLWLQDTAGDPSRTFVDLTPVGNDSFMIMMRQPHPGINLSSYEAISTEAPEVVSNV